MNPKSSPRITPIATDQTATVSASIRVHPCDPWLKIEFGSRERPQADEPPGVIDRTSGLRKFSYDLIFLPQNSDGVRVGRLDRRRILKPLRASIPPPMKPLDPALHALRTTQRALPRITRIATDQTAPVSALIRVHPCDPWLRIEFGRGERQRTDEPPSAMDRTSGLRKFSYHLIFLPKNSDGLRVGRLDRRKISKPPRASCFSRPNARTVAPRRSALHVFSPFGASSPMTLATHLSVFSRRRR